MGQWNVSTLIARDSKTGKWEILEGPTEGGRVDHNVKLKELAVGGGKVKPGNGDKAKTKQYDLAAIQLGVVKRQSFL